jgi:hypothetical protein
MQGRVFHEQPFGHSGSIQLVVGGDERQAAQACGRSCLMQIEGRCELHGIITIPLAPKIKADISSPLADDGLR